MLENKILEMVMDYSIHKRYADKELLDIITKMIIQNSCLERYVQDIEYVEGTEGESFAEYDSSTNQIIFYLDNIKKNLQKQRGIENNSIYKYLNSNFLVIEYIFHEITHAQQKRVIKQAKERTLKHYLLYDSIGIGINSGKIIEKWRTEGFSAQQVRKFIENFSKLYEKNYIIRPSERMAFITASSKVNEIVKPLSDEYPELLSEKMLRYKKYKMLGYKFGYVSPFIQYYINMRVFKELFSYSVYSPFHFKENMMNLYSDLSERLFYGLPITNEEFIDMKQEIKRLEKSLY